MQYQPHANAHDRKLNPALYFVRLFMNVLLIGVLTFFIIHTILWLIRSRLDQVRKHSAGRNTMSETEQAASRPTPSRLRAGRFFTRFTSAQRALHAVCSVPFWAWRHGPPAAL